MISQVSDLFNNLDWASILRPVFLRNKEVNSISIIKVNEYFIL